ncbi:MAG: hypothetical protein J3Q66DRAFT_55713 [Benniella sp.]|nr:MAG: hypothetical protein J3Q66DRAFT_55713 [Benniella sp.]
MVHDLTEDNLTRYMFCAQDGWRDLLQEYLDSLVSTSLFEPMGENKDEDSRIGSATTETTESTKALDKHFQSHPPTDKSTDPSTRNNKRSTRKRRYKPKNLSTNPMTASEENPLVQPSHPPPVSRPNISTNATLAIKGRIQHPHSQGTEKAKDKDNSKVEMAGRKPVRNWTQPIKESNRQEIILSNGAQSKSDVDGIKPSKADNIKATNRLASNDQNGKDSQNNKGDNDNPPRSRGRGRRRGQRRPQQIGQEEAARLQPQNDPPR